MVKTLQALRLLVHRLREGGLLDKEWDSEIVKFYPFKTPLLSIVRRMAKTVNIKNWSISHQRVGGETLDGQTIQEIEGC